MRRILKALWSSLALFLAFASLAQAHSESYSFTFFEGTQYPLDVVFLRGHSDGPTIMVQGGIQGDETSGFITAQVLTRANVRKGNLIIVPRANIPSINLRKRQINVDMNRRFDQDYNIFYEDRLARVVRFLLSQSNALIHLHEGSGFYNPTYVDNLRNPKRYGQSIIVDALVYGQWNLGNTVDTALAELNPGISPENYRFKLFNTRTFDNNTNYEEMRKSLTFYALTALDIPAMAVEVSKNISQLDWKVHRQLEATIVLLRQYGVEADLPQVLPEDLDCLAGNTALRVNGQRLAPGETIDIAPGSPLTFEPMDKPASGPAPSLAVFASDRPGVNLIHAPRLALDAFNNIEIRSDGRKVGSARVRLTGSISGGENVKSPVFVCWLNGRPVFLREGETLQAVLGDQLILEGIWGSSREEVLNLKGYVAKPHSNDGQDCGWEIILDPENFMDKYQLKSRAEVAARLRVVRETPGMRRSEFYIAVMPRTIHALRLKSDTGQSLFIPWQPGGNFPLPEGRYVLEDAWSNGPADKLLTTANNLPVRTGASLAVSSGKPLQLALRQATTFAPMGAMTFTAAQPAAAAAGRCPRHATR
ncbi:MAG: M14/M99 family metallopeptidase [Desulfovibrionaceae bacterium]